MKQWFVRFKKWFFTTRKRVLQHIANYLTFRLEIARNQQEYEAILFQALWLDDWCKEHDIWLE